MAGYTGSLTDSSVIIYNSDFIFLEKAVITDHNRETMSIEVSVELPQIKSGTSLALLIVHAGGASEFSGIARTLNRGSREISLFNERQRAGRAATRYELNTPAIIKAMSTDTDWVAIQPPMQIKMVNISSTGAFFLSKNLGFAVNTLLDIEVTISGVESEFLGSIVRMQENMDDTTGYGCQFIFLEE